MKIRRTLKGSLTVESSLIISAVCLILAVVIIYCVGLLEEVREAAEEWLEAEAKRTENAAAPTLMEIGRVLRELFPFPK